MAQQDDAVIIYSIWQYYAYATWRALNGSGIAYFVYTGILLYLSRIHLKKRLDLLIEAFATVASSHPRLQLVIAGPDQVGGKSVIFPGSYRLRQNIHRFSDHH